MKYTGVVFISSLVTVGAFGPFSKPAKVETPAPVEEKSKFSFSLPKLGGESSVATENKKPLFSTVFDLDLFAPVSNQNDYGARNNKKLTTGKISAGKSYVPTGLTAAQYEKIRKEQAEKKAANYQRNVKKAGKFQDYTDFYIKRGTDKSESWFKSVTKGHTMAKTKYDWSGDTDKPVWAKKE